MFAAFLILFVTSCTAEKINCYKCAEGDLGKLDEFIKDLNVPASRKTHMDDYIRRKMFLLVSEDVGGENYGKGKREWKEKEEEGSGKEKKNWKGVKRQDANEDDLPDCKDPIKDSANSEIDTSTSSCYSVHSQIFLDMKFTIRTSDVRNACDALKKDMGSDSVLAVICADKGLLTRIAKLLDIPKLVALIKTEVDALPTLTLPASEVMLFRKEPKELLDCFPDEWNSLKTNFDDFFLKIMLLKTEKKQEMFDKIKNQLSAEAKEFLAKLHELFTGAEEIKVECDECVTDKCNVKWRVSNKKDTSCGTRLENQILKVFLALALEILFVLAFQN